MRRQKAILAALAAVIEFMSGRTTMTADTSTGLLAPSTTLADWNKPRTVTMNLAAFSSFDFCFEGEKVSLTPAEIFAALKE